jgi:hypothetical protein
LLLEQIEHRTPVGACRLHDHWPAVLCSQPVGERQQVIRHGAVGAHFFVNGSVDAGGQQARHHKPLVNVQPTAALVQHPHVSPLLSVTPGGNPERKEGSVRCLLLRHTLLRAAHTRARQRPVRRDTRSKLLAGSWHDGMSPSDTDPRTHFHPCRRVSPRVNCCRTTVVERLCCRTTLRPRDRHAAWRYGATQYDAC